MKFYPETIGHFDEITKPNIILPLTVLAIKELLRPGGNDRSILTTLNKQTITQQDYDMSKETRK